MRAPGALMPTVRPSRSMWANGAFHALALDLIRPFWMSKSTEPSRSRALPPARPARRGCLTTPQPLQVMPLGLAMMSVAGAPKVSMVPSSKLRAVGADLVDDSLGGAAILW